MSEAFPLTATRGAANPRRVVAYTSPTRRTYVGMTERTNGVLEITGSPGAVHAVKLDFSNMLDEGEMIIGASITDGPATLENVHSDSLYFNVSAWPECSQEFVVTIETNHNERQPFRFSARASACVSPANNNRGVV